MHDDESRYRDALMRIAEIAGQLTQGDGRGEDGPMAAAEEASPAAAGSNLGCTIKTLPARLHLKAAQVAAKVNPVNAPLREPLGRPVAVPAPMRLTLDTARYWGPAPRMLTVSFMDSPAADLRARIVSHLNAWSATCGISFVETADTGEVRISRGPGGYYSYLGTDVMLTRPTTRR